MLTFEIPWKGKTSHGTVAGLFLTDVLLVVGGLAPSHALPEGTGSQRKGSLSHEPDSWSLGRILSRGRCGSSWGGRWSGCAIAPGINNNRIYSPSKKHVNQLKLM